MQKTFKCPCCGKETTVEIGVTISQKVELHEDMTSTESIRLVGVSIDPVDFENTMRREHEANRSD